MAATTLAIKLIESDPNVRDGRPVVAGTGVCVSDVVAASLFQGQTPEEIAVGYRLTLAQVHAALAYYYQHKPIIDEEIRQRDALITAFKEEHAGRRD